MREVILSTGKKAYVTNILADGTERDSMEGYKVPYNENTAVAYHILANIIMREAKKNKLREKQVEEPSENSE